MPGIDKLELPKSPWRLTKRIVILAAATIAVTSSVQAQVADRFGGGESPSTAEPSTELPGATVTKKTPFFIVNDNIIADYYAFTATNPGAGTTPKNVLHFSHFDVWAYGSNYVNVEWLKATNGSNPPYGAPRAPCDQGGPDFPPGADQCSGYSEVYGFFRSTLGWNQLSGTKQFSYGPLKNIEFIVGGDANTDNTTVASRKRAVMGGLQFAFDTPNKGFLNAAVMAYKEWQNDGFASTFPTQPIPNPSGNVEFDTTWAVELNYSQPLWSTPFKYSALVVIHGAKGCGEPCQPLGPGALRTTEFLTQQLLIFDVGKAFWNDPGHYAVFAGYRWWKNKFGISGDQPNGPFPFTDESTWLLGSAVKF